MQPFFLPGSKGDLFSLFLTPKSSTLKILTPENSATFPKQAILYFPPFAEEMNKSRRMMSLQAHQFVAQGYAVFIPDYYGTGDSEGDFSQASWEIWQDDIRRAMAWLQEQGIEQFTFWGLRLGCLMAAKMANEYSDQIDKIIFWHPLIKGEQAMTQFLRLRLAADMMSDDETKGEKVSTRQLRDKLAQGETLEVAGYGLAPDLVQQIDGLNMAECITSDICPIHWFELVAAEGRQAGFQSRQLIQQWQEAGIDVQAHVVVGEQFWMTTEITEVPALIDKTTSTL